MKRTAYNQAAGTDYSPADLVICYAPSQVPTYDYNCSACYLGHSHTWQQHDESIDAYRGTAPVIDPDTEYPMVEGPGAPQYTFAPPPDAQLSLL